MNRYPRCSSPRVLAVLFALVSISAACLAQAPALKAPPQPAPAAPAMTPDAVAIDKKIIGEAKIGSEIIANLSYLSDMIGPRLTGSAALKRANEWTMERMRSYGLTNA